MNRFFSLAAGAAMTLGMSATALAVDPVTIRIASDHGYAPHPAHVTELYFAERLAEEIPGSVVRTFPQKSLYAIPGAVEAAANGELEMVWGQFGKTAQVDPYMSVVVGPMLLTTPGGINELENLSTYKMLEERFAKIHGIKLFGASHLSFYMGAGSDSRLLKPEDFAGKKIRSMGPAENAALGAWGANPTTMAFGDVPPALQTKVIDGLLTSLGGFNVVKDQAPFFTVAGINGIVGDYYWIGASMEWWDGLSKEQQDIIEKLWVEEMIPFSKEANFCNDKRMLDRFGTDDPSKPGIYVMKPEEAQALADKLGDATQQWIKSNTPSGAHQWVDTFVKEARAASAANPLGSNWLEKTECAKYEALFDKYAQQVKKKK